MYCPCSLHPLNAAKEKDHALAAPRPSRCSVRADLDVWCGRKKLHSATASVRSAPPHGCLPPRTRHMARALLGVAAALLALAVDDVHTTTPGVATRKVRHPTLTEAGRARTRALHSRKHRDLSPKKEKMMNVGNRRRKKSDVGRSKRLNGRNKRRKKNDVGRSKMMNGRNRRKKKSDAERLKRLNAGRRMKKINAFVRSKTVNGKIVYPKKRNRKGREHEMLN